MELENRVASGRCVPATLGRACRYDYQEGRSRTRRRLSRQLDLRATERQRQEVEDLEDYVVVRPRRCRTQARSRRTGAQRSRASARVQRSFALTRTARRPSAVAGGPFFFFLSLAHKSAASIWTSAAPRTLKGVEPSAVGISPRRLTNDSSSGGPSSTTAT